MIVKTNDWIQHVASSGSPETCLIMATIGQAVQDLRNGYHDSLYDDPWVFIHDMVIDKKGLVYVTMIERMMEGG